MPARRKIHFRPGMSRRYGDHVTADDSEARAQSGPARDGGPVRGSVLALRFAVELATIAVLAWAGASASAGLPVRIVLAVGLPVVLMAFWGQLMAPRARRRLAEPGRLVVELIIFLAAAIGLAVSGHVLPAASYGIVAVGTAALSRRIAPEA
jgi:hypothetical protein